MTRTEIDEELRRWPDIEVIEDAEHLVKILNRDYIPKDEMLNKIQQIKDRDPLYSGRLILQELIDFINK